jgi:DNA-directed RNA polymerase subunit M/transcription elongation factor TFIIS
MMKCPKCQSVKVKETTIDDFTFISCKKCGYDDALYEGVFGERNTQREKRRYSPYKVGGGKRTRK